VAITRKIAEVTSIPTQWSGTVGEDTRESTLERAAERIRLTRHKVEAYSCYLAEEKTRLERELAIASAKLREKLELLADGHSTRASEPPW